jgi:hypothetical protein
MMGKVQSTRADDWSASSNSATITLSYTQPQRSWKGSTKTVTCRSYTQRKPSRCVDFVFIQRASPSQDSSQLRRLISPRTDTCAESLSSSTFFDANSTEISGNLCVSSRNSCNSWVDTAAQLIVFWSKALLRHPHARSSLEEMTTDTTFQRYIPDSHPDNLVPPNEIRRHILCTGPSC